MIPVRLDVVVKWKSREEERRLEALAQASRQAQAARAQLERARAEANSDPRGRGSAAEYLLADAAQSRALKDVERAHAQLEVSTKAVEASRQAWVEAHNRVEAVRRVADARRAEVLQEREVQERRASDAETLLRYGRAG